MSTTVMDRQIIESERRNTEDGGTLQISLDEDRRVQHPLDLAQKQSVKSLQPLNNSSHISLEPLYENRKPILLDNMLPRTDTNSKLVAKGKSNSIVLHPVVS